MSLCSECQSRPATVHLTTIMDGKQENVDLCEPCAGAAGLMGMADPESLIVDRKCEFCGGEAVSGVSDPAGQTVWCEPCGMEYGRIIVELYTAEFPGLDHSAVQQDRGDRPSEEFQARHAILHDKAVEILKNRKRKV